MTIYGRTGDPVTIKRVGVLADVQKLDNREPDIRDIGCLEHGSYVVVDSHGKYRLYHQAFLRADNGSREITDAIEKVTFHDVTCRICGDIGHHDTKSHVIGWTAENRLKNHLGPVKVRPPTTTKRKVGR
jgi:hypothetical protein